MIHGQPVNFKFIAVVCSADFVAYKLIARKRRLKDTCQSSMVVSILFCQNRSVNTSLHGIWRSFESLFHSYTDYQTAILIAIGQHMK